MKLGKTKLGGERKEIFTIKDGDNIYRPLPPMGKLADAGVFSRYFRVVWGYKDSQGKLRPFASPRQQNFKTKMIEVDCAAFNRVERLKAEYTEAMKAAKDAAKGGKTITAEAKKRLEELNELVGRKGRFNIDSKHHLNVIAADGKIGCLKLAGRGMTGYKALFTTLEKKGVDPSAVENGRFINFNRQGTGLETVYTVTELKETVNVEGHGEMEKAVPHSLTDAIIGRLAGEAFELDEIYPTPTEDEVRQIVEASERSEEECGLLIDKLFGAREPKKEEETAAEAPAEKAEAKAEARAEAVKEEPETQAKEEVEAKTEAPAEEVNTETGEITEPEAKAEVPAEAAAPSENAAVESDEDFLANLGVKIG